MKKNFSSRSKRAGSALTKPNYTRRFKRLGHARSKGSLSTVTSFRERCAKRNKETLTKALKPAKLDGVPGLR